MKTETRIRQELDAARRQAQNPNRTQSAREQFDFEARVLEWILEG